jgi:hypothetical protein
MTIGTRVQITAVCDGCRSEVREEGLTLRAAAARVLSKGWKLSGRVAEGTKCRCPNCRGRHLGGDATPYDRMERLRSLSAAGPKV